MANMGKLKTKTPTILLSTSSTEFCCNILLYISEKNWLKGSLSSSILKGVNVEYSRKRQLN